MHRLLRHFYHRKLLHVQCHLSAMPASDDFLLQLEALVTIRKAFKDNEYLTLEMREYANLQ